MEKKITEESIQSWANKLMFRLDEKEVKTLMSEFDVILEQMELINEIEGIEKVSPMTFPYLDYDQVLRDDDSEESESIEDLLMNSSETKGREVKVPKVVE